MSPFVVNTCVSKHVRKVLEVVCSGRPHWEADRYVNRKADVHWVVLEEDEYERLATLKKNECMSRIPGMHRLCDKSVLASLLEEYDGCDFMPKTYLVGETSNGSIPKKAWATPKIFKPDEAGGGEGIYLLFSAKDLERRMSLTKARSAVVQDYIPSPMLVNGYKWDARVYVLVLSLDPLRVYLCREGLARFACEPYEKATPQNAHKIGAHLTNYSISKYSCDYVHSDDPWDGEHGAKRSLSATMAYFERIGHDPEAMWDEISRIVATTTRAMADALQGGGVDGYDLYSGHGVGEGGADMPSPQLGTRNCFHVLGFDVMFDSKGRGWLLEVNHSPSLAIDSVYPVTGKNAERPPDPPQPIVAAPRAVDGAEEDEEQYDDGASGDAGRHAAAATLQRAWDVMTLGGRTLHKTCTCMSHHRPHVHTPCAVDVFVKASAIGDALLIVRRNMLARKGSLRRDPDDLAEGTSYDEIEV